MQPCWDTKTAWWPYLLSSVFKFIAASDVAVLSFVIRYCSSLCLWATSNPLSRASVYCATFTASTVTATMGIPTFVAGCQGSTARIARAC